MHRRALAQILYLVGCVLVIVSAALAFGTIGVSAALGTLFIITAISIGL